MGVRSAGDVLAQVTVRPQVPMGAFHALGYVCAMGAAEGLRAAGDVKFTMWASLFATVVCRTFLSFLLAKWMGMGVIGITLAMVLDWCIKAVLDIVRFRSGKWAEHRII